MDATCAIQNSIHVFSLVHINMCPGFWVHITLPDGVFLLSCITYSRLFQPAITSSVAYARIISISQVTCCQIGLEICQLAVAFSDQAYLVSNFLYDRSMTNAPNGAVSTMARTTTVSTVSPQESPTASGIPPMAA